MKPFLVTAAALIVLISGAVQAASPVLSTDIQQPVTIPYNPSLRPNTSFISFDDLLVADNYTDSEPQQIHLALAGPDAFYVMWATGKAKTGQGELTPNNPHTIASVVEYGTSPSNLDQTATGFAEVYSQIYNTSVAQIGGKTTQNYTSPILHHAVLSNLLPNTEYYYRVGDGVTFGPVMSFKSVARPGPSYPQRIIFLADWGLSHNSTTTLDHAVQSALTSPSPAVVFYIGDYCYADTWYANGTVSVPNTGFEGRISGTWQPVWDAWQRFIEPLVSQVPMLGCTGNHEIEEQSNNDIFTSVQARWKVPSEASSSPSYFFYSADIGPSHNIFLSPYVDYTEGSPQWNWLLNDLETVNRTVTPWVTVNIHNPLYTTDASYKEMEQFRVAIETLTFEYGIDLFFYGHVHSYERTTPVYNYTVDLCGAVHITIGDGGNSEGLSAIDRTTKQHVYEDLNGGCPRPANESVRPGFFYPVDPSVDPWSYYRRTFTFQADGNSTGTGNPPGYCYKEQPQWSAYRESSFGHGVLDILNATHALWQWHRNQDAQPVVADAVYIVREVQNCPNRQGQGISGLDGTETTGGGYQFSAVQLPESSSGVRASSQSTSASAIAGRKLKTTAVDLDL